MATADKVRELLKDFTRGPEQVLTGTVLEIYEEELKIDVEIPEAPEVYDVRLKPALDDSANYFVQFPRKGSNVMIGIIENDPDSAYLISCNDLEKFLVKIGEMTFQMTEERFVINKGENDGLINIVPLVEKINDLENEIKVLKCALTQWLPAPMDGGSALKAAITDWAAQPIVLTKKEDLEDTKVVH